LIDERRLYRDELTLRYLPREEIYGSLPTVVESNIWRVALNPNQQHLGRTFIGLREHKPSLSDLTSEEMLEFQRIVIELESEVRAAFRPDLFNWMCLMNNAVRDGQQTHVHWHMVPRYEKPVEFNGHIYTDDAWSRPFNTGEDPAYFATSDEIAAITHAIRG